MSILNEGYVIQNEPWSTPPTMTSLYKFGLIPRKADAEPLLDWEMNPSVNQQTTLGSYNPTNSAGNNELNGFTTKFLLVNGVPLWWMLGGVSDDAGVKTLAYLDGSARKPRLAVRQKVGSKYFQFYGLMNVETVLELMNGRALCTQKWISTGFERVETAEPTYSFPSNIETKYSHCNTMTFSSLSDLRPIYARARWVHADAVGLPAQEGGFNDVDEFSPIFSSMFFQFYAEHVESVIDEMTDQDAINTVFQMKKASDPTKYITINGTNGIQQTFKPLTGYNKKHIINVGLTYDTLIPVLNDGLANAMYGL